MATKKCPECKGKMVLAPIDGYVWDIVCSKCGLVVDTIALRDFREEEENESESESEEEI